MRLVLVVAQAADVAVLLRDFAELGIPATQIEGDAAVGRAGLAALLLGVGDDQVADVLTLVHVRAHRRTRRVEPPRPVGERADVWTPGPYEQSAGGASVFVLPVQRFERIGYA